MATRQDWDKFKRIFSGLFGVEPTYPQPRDTTPSNMIDKYIVQPGDNLTIISTKQKSPVEDLIKANPQLKDPNKLQIGDTLNIPAFVTPPESEINNVSAKHWGVTGDEGLSDEELKKQMQESNKKSNKPLSSKSNTYKMYGKDMVLTDKFLDFVKSLENSVKRGYDSETGLWYAYNSPEGGGETIGYGTKIYSKTHPLYEDVKKGKGFTDQEVHDITYQDLSNAYDRVRNWVAKNYDTIAFDTLQPQIKQAAVYKQYQSRGGIGAFPKFMDALIRGDLDAARRENATYFKGKDGKWYKTGASERLEDLLYYRNYE